MICHRSERASPGAFDQLMPEMRAPLGIAVGAFLLHPHRRRQDQIGRHRGNRRIGVRDDNEVVGIAIAGIGLVRVVGRGLQVVVDLDPVEIELAVLQHAVLLDGVVAGLLRNDAIRHAPDFLGMLAVFGIGDRHVGRQPMREGADLARGAAGGRLSGKRERGVAGLGDLSRQQMKIVDELVRPDAADMLVETHRPERHDLALRIGVELGKLLQEPGFDAADFETPFQACTPSRTWRRHRNRSAELRRRWLLLSLHLERMLRPQPVADVGRALHEARMVRRRSPGSPGRSR